MALFRDINQPGRGIPKAPVEKKGFFKFWEIYGRKVWKLVALNMIYFIFCIPIITIGPATAAMTKVCRNFSQERNAFIWADFIDAFKKSFKQSFVMGLIDIIAFVGFSVAIPTYSDWAKNNSSMMYIPFFICLCCVIFFVMMHFYIYLMIVSTNLSLKQILKNSFFLGGVGLKNSLFTLLVWFIVIFTMIAFWPYSVLIMPFFPLSFMCLVTAFNCYPVIRKYVIQPYYDSRGEDNPEFDYLKPADEDETVFADSPHLETAKPKSDKRRGKTIS